MFKFGEVVTARFGMMRDRRLTVIDPGYPSKAIYCRNEYSEEWCFRPDELAYYAIELETAITIECISQYNPLLQDSPLLRALDISVADLSIRSTAASIPNVVEE
jgi:hypothetical protein